MSCERVYGELFQCQFCETQFERGVAGQGLNGEPRCPQCGLTNARPIPPEQAGPFVVTRGLTFG